RAELAASTAPRAMASDFFILGCLLQRIYSGGNGVWDDGRLAQNACNAERAAAQPRGLIFEYPEYQEWGSEGTSRKRARRRPANSLQFARVRAHIEAHNVHHQ